MSQRAVNQTAGFERSNQVSAAEAIPRIVQPLRGRIGSIGRAIAASIALSLLLAASPARAQQSVDHPDAVVARPVVNMYRNATDASDVVSQALYGTGVLTLQSSQDWFKILTADGYTGWVQAADLKMLNGNSYAPKGNAVRVTAISANVYREPDVTAHAPLLQLPWESRLEPAPAPAKNTERWLEVRLVDGQSAWVQRGDISDDFLPISTDEMLRLAHRFIGTTYTWGGVSSFGFDCSGFTQMLERQRGFEMPRDADIQASWSGVIAVERKNLQPGDLLYFGSSPSKITHTGMYLGNGEFIHDTTHGHPGVQISRLDDMPWTQILVAIRRVKP
jgi:gamma-D-glutamyl-L-lysine dipeptidyl-peptidase